MTDNPTRDFARHFAWDAEAMKKADCRAERSRGELKSCFKTQLVLLQAASENAQRYLASGKTQDDWTRVAKAVIVVRDSLAQVVEKCGDDACHSLTPADAEPYKAAGIELHVAAAAAVANSKP